MEPAEISILRDVNISLRKAMQRMIDCNASASAIQALTELITSCDFAINGRNEFARFAASDSRLRKQTLVIGTAGGDSDPNRDVVQQFFGNQPEA